MNDTKINDALVALKRRHPELCWEFDHAVERARSLPFLDRLNFVAQEKNRLDLYKELVEILDPPAVVLEHREGEYVHWKIIATFYAEFVDGAWYVRGEDNEAWEHPRTPKEFEGLWMEQEDIISHGFLKGTTSPSIPEIGKWIRATTKDGKTHQFQVTDNDDHHGGVFLQEDVSSGQDFYINLQPKESDDKTRWVVDWEYIQKPWKVGDVVPAGTVLGRVWLGRSESGIVLQVPRIHYSKLDLTILWLDKEA